VKNRAVRRGLDFASSALYLCGGNVASQTSQSSSMDTSTLKVQALLEIFWTPSPATLWYDAEFLELSTDLQQAIINELMD